MISWMQNNNKYLVITIWIATIAFIGAGFVGWGSVDFGLRSSSIAQVGNVAISKTKYSFAYNNLYSQYAQKLGNKFDGKVAKEMGLDKQVYRNLVNEALLLNLANEYGIIATEKEVGLEIVSYEAFKDKDGKFNKTIYNNFLRARGLKAKEFEAILKDEIRIRKLVKLLDIKPLEFEKEVMASTFKVADKIKYTILKKDDINITVDDKELKSYWEKNKLNYLTKTEYNLDILWTDNKDLNLTDSDIEKFYKQNSFNYLDNKGKVKPLSDVKELVYKDLKLEKLKKSAAIERSRFKKGKLKATESVTIAENDSKFDSKVWEAIKSAKEGDYLKPKAVGDKYATIHINKVIKPREMSFEEAKELVKKDYISFMQEEQVAKKAEELLKKSTDFNLEPKDYITLSKFQILPSLTPQDSLKVIRYIFGSNKKVDKVATSEGIVVYKVIEQKLLENNNTDTALNAEIKTIKSNELTSNLLKELSKKYKVESFVKGF